MPPMAGTAPLQWRLFARAKRRMRHWRGAVPAMTPSPYGNTSYENGAVTRPIFPTSWCAPGVLGVSPGDLGRRVTRSQTRAQPAGGSASPQVTAIGPPFDPVAPLMGAGEKI
jgi:hypothetical protein